MQMNRVRFILTMLAVLIFLSASSQVNLVGDPSFEDTANVAGGIGGGGQSSLLKWRNLDSTRPGACPFVDFSYTAQNNYKLPENQWFYQQSRTGNVVVDLDFIWVFNPTCKRSLARIKLLSPLVSGKIYCAKMYVNPADRYGDFFTDGIAMYFDNGQLDTIVAMDSSGVYPFVNPQVSNPTGNVLNDTMNWMPVSGTFVANGTETFLTLGNFKTDAATTRVFNPNTYVPPDTIYGSSILIDDVSVIPIDAANWLHDTTCILGDSVYIGLPQYEMPDGMWYDINMNFIKKGSGFKVKPVQWATQYIMQLDLCGTIRSDTLTVWAAPDGVNDTNIENSIEVFPNPSNSILNVRGLSTNAIGSEFKMYNTIGQLVKQNNILAKQIKFDVADLAKGVYYLICDGWCKKIIIE